MVVLIRFNQLTRCTFYFIVLLINIIGLNAQTNHIIRDIDNNEYQTIKIGTQFWMNGNLKTTKFNDGTIIPYAADSLTWKNSISPAYCWYNNSITNKDSLGGLYNWYVVSSNKICPKGWHVPNVEEYSILISYLGGKFNVVNNLRSHGFNFVYSGLRGAGDGNFHFLHHQFFLWSSTPATEKLSMIYNLPLNDNYFLDNTASRKLGVSIRCVCDSISK